MIGRCGITATKPKHQPAVAHGKCSGQAEASHPEVPRHPSSIFRPRAWPSEGREGFQAESESEFPSPGLSPGRGQRSPREAAPIFLQRPLLAPGTDLSLGRSGAWKVRLGEA